MKFQHQLEKIGVSGKGEEDMKFLCVEISESVKTYINISHIVNIIEFENSDIVDIYCINANEPISVSKQVLKDDILPYLDVRY